MLNRIEQYTNMLVLAFIKMMFELIDFCKNIDSCDCNIKSLRNTIVHTIGKRSALIAANRAYETSSGEPL